MTSGAGPRSGVAVDAWLDDLFPADEAVLAAQEAAEAAGLPQIQVSVQQGRLLALLAASIGARRVLEVGTLAGVSTLWLARGLRGRDRLITTLELLPERAVVARENLVRAGVADVVDVRVGPAIESLAQLAAEGSAPFDLAFIDADKPSNTAYVRAVLPLLRPGGLLVVDNVVRSGAVLDAVPDASAAGSRAVVEMLAAQPGLTATVIQTVGAKGHDGMLVARLDD